MPEGTYQVLVKKTGYKEKHITMSISKGKMSEMIVEMEKCDGIK